MKLEKIALAAGIAITGLVTYVGYKLWQGFRVGGANRQFWNLAVTGFKQSDGLFFEPEVKKILSDLQITTTPLFERDCVTNRDWLAFTQQRAAVFLVHNKKVREWVDFDVMAITEDQVRAKFLEFDDIDHRGYVTADDNMKQFLPSNRILRSLKPETLT